MSNQFPKSVPDTQSLTSFFTLAPGLKCEARRMYPVINEPENEYLPQPVRRAGRLTRQSLLRQFLSTL